MTKDFYAAFKNFSAEEWKVRFRKELKNDIKFEAFAEAQKGGVKNIGGLTLSEEQILTDTKVSLRPISFVPCSDQTDFKKLGFSGGISNQQGNKGSICVDVFETGQPLEALEAASFGFAGGGIVGELAFALAQIESKLNNNKAVEGVAISIASNFIENTAKVLALKAILKSYAQWKGLELPEIRIIGVANRLSYVPNEPYSNLIRLTLSALASTVGCCDYFLTCSIHPEEGAKKDEEIESLRLSANILNLFREESNLETYTNPATGAEVISSKVLQFAGDAWGEFSRYLQSKESMRGYFTKLIEQDFSELQAKMASKELSIIGGNLYAQELKGDSRNYFNTLSSLYFEPRFLFNKH